jgi:toxin ParE1/3/4
VKPAIRSTVAEADIEAAIDFYLAEEPGAAPGFVDALERAIAHIESHPASGSPRYSIELGIPELRFRALARYPFALFYLEHDDHLTVIRCAHMSRDIPESLRGERGGAD